MGEGSKCYLATWEMHIYADTPEDAARQARYYQTRPGTTATVFEIIDDEGNTTTVDLTELDEEREPLTEVEQLPGGGVIA